MGIAELLVFALFLSGAKRSSSSVPGATPPPSGPPQGAPPNALPSSGPATTTASVPAGSPQLKVNTVPAGTRPAGDWRPYHPPPAAVVQRAAAILSKPALGAQVIEPDPSGVFPKVLYQREKASTGRVSVTAWRGSQPRVANA